MKVYVVMAVDYDFCDIVGVYSNTKDADLAIAASKLKEPKYEHVMESFEVDGNKLETTRGR